MNEVIKLEGTYEVEYEELKKILLYNIKKFEKTYDTKIDSYLVHNEKTGKTFLTLIKKS